jgi:hypothetical protein
MVARAVCYTWNEQEYHWEQLISLYKSNLVICHDTNGISAGWGESTENGLTNNCEVLIIKDDRCNNITTCELDRTSPESLSKPEQLSVRRCCRHCHTVILHSRCIEQALSGIKISVYFWFYSIRAGWKVVEQAWAVLGLYNHEFRVRTNLRRLVGKLNQKVAENPEKVSLLRNRL